MPDRDTHEVLYYIGIHGSGVQTLRRGQYGQIVKTILNWNILPGAITVGGNKLMHCYYFHVVMMWDGEITVQVIGHIF